MGDLVKHLLKRKKQFKKVMDELDRLGKKLPGVMRESDRRKEVNEYTLSGQRLRKKRKKTGK